MSDTTTFLRPVESRRSSSREYRRRQFRTRETVRLFQGNTSECANRVVTTGYESVRRSFHKLECILPVVAWFYIYDRPPVRGTPVNGTTYQMDTCGLLLRTRLPEHAWVGALMTGRMKVRLGITLPDYRERIVATAVVGWMEAHEPIEPMRLGLLFSEISEKDLLRIRSLLAADRRRKELLSQMQRHRAANASGQHDVWSAETGPMQNHQGGGSTSEGTH